MSTVKRESFGSRFAIIMALAGSAIGLGNIWRFPYMVGEYGGAAFVIVYLLCSVFISLPIFFCEMMLGRKARKGTFGAMEGLAPGTKWKWLGFVTVAGCFIILSYYSVVGGWSVDFLWKSCMGIFAGGDPDAVTKVFGEMSSSTWEPLLMHTMFLGFSALIVVGGVKKGIEKFTKVTMPVLICVMLAIAVFSCTLPGAHTGIEYLVNPDFTKLTPKALAFALGQSFFSLSLGVGTVLIYSSYMKKEESILMSGTSTAFFDSVFALIAGFAVMPAVFSAGLAPSAGPSLVFETVPYIFAEMGVTAPLVSRVVMIAFFLSILMAALTSEISLLEVCVAHLVEQHRMSRKIASLVVFSAAWVLGALCSLSFGPLGDMKLFGLGIFDFCDTLSSNYIMMAGALVFALFVGWKMKKDSVRDEFTNGGTLSVSSKLFGAVYFLIRWIAPVAIAVIFVTNFLS